jgi:hypothetical protein
MDNPSLSEIVNEERRKESGVTMDKSSPSAATIGKRKSERRKKVPTTRSSDFLW